MFILDGVVFSKTIHPPPRTKNTKKPHSPKNIHSSSLLGVGAHPLGYHLIPLLGGDNIALLLPNREGGRRALLVNPNPRREEAHSVGLGALPARLEYYGGGLYREMSRLSGFRVLGVLGLLGYLIPYLGLLPFVPSIIPKTISPRPSPQDHLSKTISNGARRHPLGYHLIPILGVIMCCMGFYLSPPHREGGDDPH